MKIKNLIPLLFSLVITGASLATTTVSLSTIYRQLASCLLNIDPNNNSCTVNLDHNYDLQRQLGLAIRDTMEDGNTYHIILMDKEGHLYNTWQEYYEETDGISYIQINYIDEFSYLIRTNLNGGDITENRRIYDFEIAIDTLNRDLLS